MREGLAADSDGATLSGAQGGSYTHVACQLTLALLHLLGVVWCNGLMASMLTVRILSYRAWGVLPCLSSPSVRRPCVRLLGMPPSWWPGSHTSLQRLPHGSFMRLPTRRCGRWATRQRRPRCSASPSRTSGWTWTQRQEVGRWASVESALACFSASSLPSAPHTLPSSTSTHELAFVNDRSVTGPTRLTLTPLTAPTGQSLGRHASPSPSSAWW
jgi:hypothetical protein